MATLKVVGSGSQQGNTYILETSEEKLMLDLGCKWIDIMESLKFDIGKVAGCLVSHR